MNVEIADLEISSPFIIQFDVPLPILKLQEDYFLGKGGYCYVNRDGLEIRSLHYVDQKNVGTVKDPDVIFKKYVILVQGKSYFPEDFIKLLRNKQTERKDTVS